MISVKTLKSLYIYILEVFYFYRTIEIYVILYIIHSYLNVLCIVNCNELKECIW